MLLPRPDNLLVMYSVACLVSLLAEGCLNVSFFFVCLWVVDGFSWVIFPPHTPKEAIYPRRGEDDEGIGWFANVYPRTKSPLWPHHKPIEFIQKPGEVGWDCGDLFSSFQHPPVGNRVLLLTVEWG